MENKGKIIIVGDFFPVPFNFTKFSEGDVSYLLGDKICSLFADADYRICNLEGALTDNDDFCEKTGPVVKAPTVTIEAYKKLGIDCCCLANNHITDAGHQGVIDTMRTLDKANIRHIGAGENETTINHFLSFRVANKNVGLYNVCETMYNKPTKSRAGAFIYDEYIVCHELETFKKTCDYLIVIYHGGAEKFRYPSPQTKKRFHRMVDSGADLILSQHTHCVGSEEYYKGAYLLYGQGNFLFRSFNNEFTDTGLIIEIDFSDQVYVKKHLVNAVGDTVRYDEKQDFTEFDKRSALVGNEDYVNDKYQQYCLSELATYLYAYKSQYWKLGIMRRLFPNYYKKYLMNQAFRRRDLLMTLHSLRSEQNRETAICGIETLLKMKRE